MRAVLLAAVIAGTLFVPLYAQAPEPTDEETTEQMGEQKTTEETIKPKKMSEPVKSQQMEEPTEMAGNLTVKEMTFCDSVENRQPTSMDSVFSADIGKIYFWSNILNDDEETYVEHVWFYQGEEKARVNLPVKHPRNRIWSYKTILPEWTGEWTVMIMAGDEKLGELTCTVE